MYQPIWNKNSSWEPCFLSEIDKTMKLCKGPSIDAPHHILIHLANWFKRRRFLFYQPIRNKNHPWWPCFLSDCDKTSNICKGPSIDALCNVGSILPSHFRGEDKNKNGYGQQMPSDDKAHMARKSVVKAELLPVYIFDTSSTSLYLSHLQGHS